MARITTESFIERSKAKCPGEFTYERTTYDPKNKFVVLTCVKHGDVEVNKVKHLHRGDGCHLCAGKRMNTERAIALAKEVHGDLYGYDNFEYTKAHDKTQVTCKLHWNWSVSYSNHILNKSGCPTCGGTSLKTQEQFITEANAVHNFKYSYPRTEYVNDSTKLLVTCTEHGNFSVCPSNHLQGQGCKKCAKNGYNVTKPGYIYVMTFDNVTKIGITNREPEIRLKEVNRGSGKSFKLFSYIFLEDGSVPLSVETELLQEINVTHKSPEEKYTGSTECFTDLEPRELLGRITKLLYHNLQTRK